MTKVERPIDELDRYLSAREFLASMNEQVEDLDLHGYLSETTMPPRDRLDGIIAMLCEQARAAQRLASEAETLCSVLAADRHHRKA